MIDKKKYLCARFGRGQSLLVVRCLLSARKSQEASFFSMSCERPEGVQKKCTNRNYLPISVPELLKNTKVSAESVR